MNFWRKHPSAAPIHQERPPLWTPPARLQGRPWLHLLLFLLTLLSVATAGAYQQGVNPFASLPTSLVHLIEGAPFAVTLLTILTVHEFGHYFAARRWGVRASLPYFLPLPPFPFILGTGGAVIKIRSPIPHRRALLDIGAAGPLAGFIVAIAACFIGLTQSQIVTSDYLFQPIHLGSPALFTGISALLLPELGADQMVLLNPVAFAGWVGLFITAFNLFPVGQLDGGHIVYALFGRHHRHIARLTFAVLLGMGLYGILSIMWGWPYGWPGWMMLALLLTFLGREHPAPVDPVLALDPRRRLVGYLCLLVFALCFTPVPFEF